MNKGLLYLELRDHANALLDFSEAGKVIYSTYTAMADTPLMHDHLVYS